MSDLNLIKELVVLLSPALPYLAPAGEEILKEVGKDLGASISSKARKIWMLLNSEIILKPPLEEAIKEVAKNPADDDAHGALRLQLRKLLENNPSLAQQFSEIMANPETKRDIINITQTATGDHTVQVGQIGGSFTMK